MVKRYDSPRRRAKVLKELPFYQRYPKEMMALAVIGPLVYVFGPPFYRFFFPPTSGRYRALDPRREENISKLRQKYMERETGLKNIGYFNDDE